MATEVDTGVAAHRRSRSRRAAIISALATSALAVVVFAPILYYMVLHWGQVPDYSHGYLIAPLSAYFIWERRKQLARTPIEPSWWGLIPLALGALALAIGRLGVELMSMRVAFVLTLIGIQVLLLGIPIIRVLAFPLCFLFLMVPLPQSLVNVIAFPLQLIAADLAVNALHLFGMPVLREGNILHPARDPLFVAEACSGLRSLMALGTLGVLFAYFFRKSWLERIVLVASTIPIAIARQCVPRRADRRAHLRLGTADGRRRDPPDRGLLHVRHGVRAADARGDAALAAAALRSRRRRRADGMSKLIVAIAFLALNVYIYYFMAREAVIPPRENFAAFPLEIERLALRAATSRSTAKSSRTSAPPTRWSATTSRERRSEHDRRSTSATTPPRCARKAAAPARTRSIRPRTACRARAGTSSTAAPCRSMLPGLSDPDGTGKAPDHRQGRGSASSSTTGTRCRGA